MSLSFPAAVYILCLVTSGACAYLLARNYRRTGTRLLMWSALCFLLLALNNAVVFLDALVIEVDLAIPRLALSLAAVSVLLFGFIWDLEQ